MELKQYRFLSSDYAKSPHVMALHLFYTEKYPACKSWPKMVSGITRVRGKTFTWTTPQDDRPTKSILDWIKNTPVVKDWVVSPRCLVSPSDWPTAIYPSFRHHLIPSPYEITNVDLCSRYRGPPQYLKNLYVVLLYGMGFTVEEIAEGMKTTEAEVLRRMADGITGLTEMPQYLLWASGTNFNKAVYPVNIMRLPLQNRAAIVTTLKRNPFRLNNTQAKLLLTNPSYVSYLIYSSPKRMRLTKDCRLYRTGER